MSEAPLRLLGLDLGTCTGYALSSGSKIVRSGVRDFSVKSSQHKGQRGIKFYNFLLTLGQVDAVFYERAMFGGNFKNKKGEWVAPSSDGREFVHGLIMLVEMYAAGFNIPTYPVHASTLKKNFTGNGRAEKVDMCSTARSLGWQGGAENTATFHDEVDACALVITEARDRYGLNITF